MFLAQALLLSFREGVSKLRPPPQMPVLENKVLLAHGHAHSLHIAYGYLCYNGS